MRQLALLHFRNTITLSVKLEDALARAHARVPPAIVQMLLVLQVGGARGGHAHSCVGSVGGGGGERWWGAGSPDPEHMTCQSWGEGSGSGPGVGKR